MQHRAKWISALLLVSTILLASTRQSGSTDNFTLVGKILFSSVQNQPACMGSFVPGKEPSIGEIYLMNPDGTDVQQLTDNHNCAYGDLFAASSPDGKKIVFDSTRLNTDTSNPNISDLFLMEPDGSNQTWLVRGSSASWSPVTQIGSSAESRQIVFHASASGTSTPIRPDPGAPTYDSDLFVLNVDDCLAYLAQGGTTCRHIATDITKNLGPSDTAPDYNSGQFSPPAAPAIKEDADWSPDGSKIVFTSHTAITQYCSKPQTCNYPDTQIYVVNADGSGLTQLTHLDPNLGAYEKRAPAWSPDGLHIAYMCRIGPLNANGSGLPSFEICVIPATGDGVGTNYTRLTANNVLDATPSWSPDGSQIVFHRNPPPFQLYLVKGDTNCYANSDSSFSCHCPSGTYAASGTCEMQLTDTQNVMNGFPHWGELRIHVKQ